MANFSLGITWEQNTISKLNHGKLMNDVMRDMGMAHKLRHLPKHFESVPETSVGGAYGYAARSIRWQRRKQREGRPLIANVYTGRMRETVLRNSKVTATQTRARVYVKNYFPMRDSQRRELEAVTDSEVKFLANRTHKNYANLSKTEKYKRKKRVKLSG